MAKATKQKVQDVANEVQIGYNPITKDEISNAVGAGRKLAPLSAARTIQKTGQYWISAENVPTEVGFYRDNKDGTFTKVSERAQVSWEDRLHVNEEAAALAAKGSGPLVLSVIYDFNAGRLQIKTGQRFIYLARVATVGQAQAKSQTKPTKATKSKSIEVPTRQFNAAKKAFRKAEPTMNPDLADALRAVFGEQK